MLTSPADSSGLVYPELIRIISAGKFVHVKIHGLRRQLLLKTKGFSMRVTLKG
jgi:hypothetical protein